MKKILILVILVLTGIIMYLTNPGPEVFGAHVEKYISDEMSARGQDPGLLEGMFGKVLAMGIQEYSTRTNFHLGSVYTLEVGSSTYRYLGVFGTIIPLQTRQPLEDLRNEMNQ
jgi:hypothetical protein